MPGNVELIVGPTRSGKAARVLRAYLDALAARPGRCLMVVPTAIRRRETESRLLAAQDSGVLMQPQVLTLHDLAEHLLAAAGRRVRRITELARLELIRQCLARLPGKQAAVLGRSRETPGLVLALDSLFHELKDARVEPDAFSRAVGAPLDSPRNRVLAVLYTSYQRKLQDRDLYDDAGRFWHAAALAKEGKLGPFDRLAILAVDGFTDFAPAQLDMLDALSERAERTILTLTWEAGRARQNLFGITERTRARLLERFGPRLNETVAEAVGGLPPDLERVESHLFALPDGKTPPKASGSVSIFRAAGRTREVEEVARQVSDLVRSGDPLPRSIGILARSLRAYGPLVREVFPRYGLPFRVEQRRALADAPAVRAAISLFRLQDEEYAYRALARIVKSNYFRPEAFGASAATARAAVRLAREANVWEGRASYPKGFDYLRGLVRRTGEVMDESGQFALGPEAAEHRLEELDRAAKFLKSLFGGIALPEKASRGEFAERMAAIVRQAGLWDAAGEASDPAHQARDLKALQEFQAVLAEVALLDEAPAAPVAREAFLDEVEQGLGRSTVSGEDPADAPVVVMDVLESRALTFDHVFILGLAEREFPRRGRTHPFFDDGERADLAKAGVDLPDSEHAAEDEMLLFYMAVTRARRRLALSYPSLDAQGRPALPSHYLEELRGLFAPGEDGAALPVLEVGTRDLDLGRERLRSDRELLASAMFDLWGPGADPDRDEDLAILDALLGRPRDEEAQPVGDAPRISLTGQAVETALAGLAAEWEREHGEAFGPFDGILAAPDILEDLCRRVPGEEVLSAGRLETFGTCPFAYFAGKILGLEAEEEPSPDLAPMKMGLIYHSLLERFFRALAASQPSGPILSEENRDAALRLLDEEAAKYFTLLEKRGDIGSKALWRVQRKNILRDVARLVEWHIEKLPGWRPTHFEVPFGTCGKATVAAPGRAEPITLACPPHGDVHLGGRIDRIDLATAGAEGYQVVDYKSGAAPSRAAAKAGASFQLPVYLWALQALLGVWPDSDRVQAFFLPIRHPARSGLLANQDSKGNAKDAVEKSLDRAGTYIRRFVEAMRQGQYPVYPRMPCPGHCDASGICRFAEWRINRKWEAHPIVTLEILPDDEDAGAEEATP